MEGFIDRQADPEVDGVRSALRRARFLMEDVGGENPHALAERLRDRYRLISDSHSRDPVRGAQLFSDFSKWVHTAEACPLTSVAPIWRLRVTRGREWDVVRAIMKMCESKSSFILSVTASPTCRGSVYVETVSLPDLDWIVRDVAFVQRYIPPEQLPLREYQDILIITDLPEISVASWVRFTGKGDYCGDLAWIDSYDPTAMTYAVYLVPRTLRWDARKARPSGLKRPRHPVRILPAVLFPAHVGSMQQPSRLLRFDGREYRHGLMFLADVPARDLTDDNVVPSRDELGVWQQSSLYCDGNSLDALRTDPDAGPSFVAAAMSFSKSVWKMHDFLGSYCLVEEGERARVIGGEWRDMVGEVKDIDRALRTVTLYITDLDGPSVDVSFPAAAVVVDYRIGDLVEIRSGPHSGVCGWVEAVDWRALRVSLLQFTYIPNTYGRRDQTKEVAALSLKVQMHLEVEVAQRDYIASAEKPPEKQDETELDPVRRWDVAISCLRRKSGTGSSFAPPSKPEIKNAYFADFMPPPPPVSSSSSPEMPRGTVDPYVHLEVKVHKGPLRGVIGTVKNTENNGTRLLIATEGRAVNGYVHIDVDHVRERQ
ncbi:hypothetical protein B0H13DRAFT_835278 [Mycena leptocephala]|nr:hypothetical protein B0H13DRAFT_835278 [Mycena leptocephala]